MSSRLGVVVHNGSHSTWDGEARGFQVQGQPGLCLKKNTKRKKGKLRPVETIPGMGGKGDKGE
jgi:hypothetical protein